jgi:hypothetical protein
VGVGVGWMGVGGECDEYARKLFRHRYVRRTGHKTASSLHLYWHL